MESGNNFPLVYLENYDLDRKHTKLSEFDIEYRLLDHLVAQMAITVFKSCFLWDLIYKTRS